MKSTKVNILHWFFAISTTITAYAALLFIFSPIKQDTASDNNNHSHSKVFMLPIDTGRKTKQNNALLEWMKVNNPTLIINPNRIYNYSRIITRAHNFDLNYNHTLQIISDNSNVNVFKDLHISAIPVPESSIEKYELFYVPVLPQFSFKFDQTKNNYPVFTDYYTGKKLNITIPKSLGKITILNENCKIDGLSVIQIRIPADKKFFPNVRLIKSCGCSIFDNTAIKAIITQSLAEDSNLKPGSNLTIAVNWGSFDIQVKEGKKKNDTN